MEALTVKYNDEATNKYEFTVANEFIDSKTPHAVTVEYNFGQISSKSVKDGKITDYTVIGGEFKNIIFSCLEEVNDYDWVKTKDNPIPSLEYGQEDGDMSFAAIKSTNSRDGKYTVTNLGTLATAACDNMLADFKNATYELWSQDTKGGEKKEGSMNEYFVPKYRAAAAATEGKAAVAEGLTFTLGSAKQNPEATVYSTLVIKTKDYFGHDVVIEVKDFEVKKR